MRFEEWIKRVMAILLMWLSIAHYISDDTQSAIYSLLLSIALTQAKWSTP